MFQELPSDGSVAPKGAKIGRGTAVGIQGTEKAEPEPGLRGPGGRGGRKEDGCGRGAGPGGGRLLPLPITTSGSQGTQGVQDEIEQGDIRGKM